MVVAVALRVYKFYVCLFVTLKLIQSVSYCYLLTPCSRALLEKPVVAQLIRTLSEFH